MKAFLLSALLFCLPLISFALDPHDAQITAITVPILLQNSAAGATTYANLAGFSLTSHAVNSGTNSYIVDVDLEFVESSGANNAVYFQLTSTISSTTTAVASTVTGVGGRGHIHLMAELESIAVSTVFNVQQKFTYASNPGNTGTVTVTAATMRIVGLAGNTQ